MTLHAGTRLGHYEIVASLGEGGMGQVYRALDTRLGREVALKVLTPDVASNPDSLGRFQREARAVAALNHPHIITLHSVEESGGVHFLTMELVEGSTLADVLEAHRAADPGAPARGLAADRLLSITAAIAEALTAAHEKGIVHRDLKPANVMIASDGRVKVLDFGLAKTDVDPLTADRTMTRGLTREGVVMGTFPYMSPEQISGRAVDHRTDLFSLGVMLYEMAGGRRPFAGESSAELTSAILRDTPAPISDLRADLPPELVKLVRRCLEKDVNRRVQTARDVANEIADIRSASPPAPSQAARGRRVESGAVRLEDGFWIAVLPFKHRGTATELEALADGLGEDVVTGLSRFSYLRVISRSSTGRHATDASDVREIGRELGARYVMEGSIRQAGSVLRIAVQLVDAANGAHLWAETFNRAFEADRIFDLLDDVVPRIVCTVADQHGVLPQTMSAALRGRRPDDLTPYEAALRSLGYTDRIGPDEHGEVTACLERAVERAPDDAVCWALVSRMYCDEHKHGFNVRPDSLDRAIAAARRAVDLAPSNHLGHYALAQAQYFRREIPAFKRAAERAIALNPMDRDCLALMGTLLAYTGEWERGCALARRAADLAPQHPGWYRFAAVWDAFRKGDYRGALDVAQAIDMPGYLYAHVTLASLHGHLGDRDAARRALDALLGQRPDFAAAARADLEKWFGPGELLERIIEGLGKAGLAAREPAAATAGAGRREPAGPPGAAVAASAVALAILPFTDMSAAKDQAYLCEGMAEEIMTALVAVEGIRVASRTSTFRARQQSDDLPAIGRLLSVDHVLEGSVRTAGQRLRVTAQLIDVGTGYHVWSDRYDRDATDVFAVQDDIAAGVVDAVKTRLAPGTASVRLRAQVGNLEAYQQYLMGRYLRYTKNDHLGGLRCYARATELDPSHGPSWVGVAETTVLSAFYALMPTREAHATARRALETAARLQGESAEARAVEGAMGCAERRWEEAHSALVRAVELGPEHVQALCWLGVVLTTVGRRSDAAPVLERARGIDPLAQYPHAMSGLCLLLEGRIGEACQMFEHAVALEGGSTLALWGSAVAEAAAGRADVAIARLESAMSPPQQGGYIHGILGWAFAKAGRADESRRVLAAIEARAAGAPAVVSEAWLLAALGDREAALDILEQAERECQYSLTLIGLPTFDPLRAEPRFRALLGRMGLGHLSAG